MSVMMLAVNGSLILMRLQNFSINRGRDIIVFYFLCVSFFVVVVFSVFVWCTEVFLVPRLRGIK